MNRMHAAYLRKSSATADQPGNDSRDAQLEAIRRLCGPDVQVFEDWGMSGGRADRPEYQRLRGLIAAGEVESVCAYSLTRYGRNLRELLDFVELCKVHDVTIRAAVDSIDTSTASGRAMLQMMAVMSELELEQGKERSASARAARLARYAAAGLDEPPAVPVYGRKRVKRDDGLSIVVDDPDRPVEPVIDAYREAGSFAGAALILNRRGVSAPRPCAPDCTSAHHRRGRCRHDCTIVHPHEGRWATSTVRRVLMAHIPEDLPASHGRLTFRPRRPALFAGLMRCACGSAMTPNVERASYYCQRCKLAGMAGLREQGPYSVSERRLLSVLRPEAERFDRHVLIERRAADDTGKAVDRLHKRRDSMLDAAVAHPNLAARYSAEVAKIDAEIATLQVSGKAEVWLESEAAPEWSDVAAMNAHLRRIWRVVNLDSQYRPTVDWAVSAFRYDESAEDEWQATHDPVTTAPIA